MSRNYGYDSPVLTGGRSSVASQATFLTYAFFWMAIGLAVTGIVSITVAASPALRGATTGLLLPVIIAQLTLVLVMSGFMPRIGATAAMVLYVGFTAVEGLMVGVIVAAYLATAGGAAALIASFSAASATFGAGAFYGAVTRRNLGTLGGYLFMAVIGLLVAMFVNILLASSLLYWIISFAGVIVFTLLAAYDIQRIGNGKVTAFAGSMEKGAIFGALALYLDFINLFLMFLRIFGGAGKK